MASPPSPAAREFASPSLVDVADDASINSMLADRVARADRAVMYERKVDGAWQPVTGTQFAAEVAGVAKGLVARGVEPGDRVAIMARTRYEWTVLDFAIWAAAAISVPVYETSSVEQIAWILTDAKVTLAIVEHAEHAERVAAVPADDRATLTGTLVIDDGALATLTAEGAGVDDAELARRQGLPTLDDVATYIYTSGTTGRPKGVELTHRNFVTLALNGVEGLGEVCAVPGARTLLFMPLAHVFARFIEVLVVPSGAVLGHTSNPADLLADLGTFRPTFLLAVPRVFERVYNSSEQKAGGGLKLKIFRWSAKVSITYSRALDGRGPSLLLRLQHRVADKLVLHKIRHALGGQVTYAVSGGAPLGTRLGHFYRGIGLQVLEGYGLTETTAPTAVNRPGHIKIGTVGPPFPGTAARIADDGEILVRGDHVFRGYHDNPSATAEALVDGWFRTGDLGQLDHEGFLTITGRAKEIIVTAGGKNVAPALLEDRLRGHPIVSQCVVVGDQRPFIGALVTLDAQMLPGWLANHDLPEMSVAEAATHPEVNAALRRAVTRANEAVSRAESIREITILDTDFTEENGYLTPSLKVKRSAVLKDFAHVIDELYTSAALRRAKEGSVD